MRVTGRDRAQLIGTAATPLGGDELDITVRVESGAHLDLGSVAATIALPSHGQVASTARWHIQVDANARLVLDPQPIVVAGGAVHSSQTTVDLRSGAGLVLHEHVQIGRSASTMAERDRASRWSGGLCVRLDDQTVLAHRVELGEGSPAARTGHRAMSGVLRYPDARDGEVHPTWFAARLSLVDDATLTTALGESVSATRRLADELELFALHRG